jgi:ribonuclease HI
MYFDGSKRFQGAGAGVVLISPQGDKLKYVLRMSFPQASNNEAEYEALLHGMKMPKRAEQLDWKYLETRISLSNK